VTANMLTMGALGIVMPFPAKFKLKVLDPSPSTCSPRRSATRGAGHGGAELIRSRLQETIYEMLRDRRSVWFG